MLCVLKMMIMDKVRKSLKRGSPAVGVSWFALDLIESRPLRPKWIAIRSHATAKQPGLGGGGGGFVNLLRTSSTSRGSIFDLVVSLTQIFPFCILYRSVLFFVSVFRWFNDEKFALIIILNLLLLLLNSFSETERRKWKKEKKEELLSLETFG